METMKITSVSFKDKNMHFEQCFDSNLNLHKKKSEKKYQIYNRGFLNLNWVLLNFQYSLTKRG